MPDLNGRGQIGAGVAGGRISIDNVDIAAGGCACWLTDDILIWGGPDPSGNWVLRSYDQRTRTFATIGTNATFLAAGDGRYAAFGPALSTNGWPFAPPTSRSALTITDGRGAANPDGLIALCDDQSCTTVSVYAPGQDLAIDHLPAVAYNLCLIRPGAYVWDGGSAGYTCVTPVPMTRRQIVTLNGEDWIVGYASGIGVVALPNGATEGYILAPAPMNAYHHRARVIGGQLFVCWSSTQGEAPNTNTLVSVDPHQPRVPIVVPAQPVSVPPVNKAVLVAWLSDVDTPAPANATCRINFRPGPNDNLIRVGGQPVAAFLDREDSLDGLEQAIAQQRALTPTLPMCVYWPRGFWGQHCSAEIYGVEAYWHVTETRDQFKTAVAAELANHGRCWPVAQAYTSNTGNTPDTGDVVPVIAELLREHANTDGCLPFSAGTRPSGWNDLDARTHQAWTDLVASVTGVPHVEPIPPAPHPIPPQPPVLPGELLAMFTTIDPTKVIVAYAVKPSAQAGCINVLVDAAGTVFSAHGDTRPPGTDGAWEAGQLTGSGIVTFWADGKAHSYGLVYTDKLPK